MHDLELQESNDPPTTTPKRATSRSETYKAAQPRPIEMGIVLLYGDHSCDWPVAYSNPSGIAEFASTVGTTRLMAHTDSLS